MSENENEIGQDELAQAHALLADWWNARRAADDPEYTAEAFADWQAGRREEFLVMAPAGGMSNQLYLVGSGVVRPQLAGARVARGSAGGRAR